MCKKLRLHHSVYMLYTKWESHFFELSRWIETIHRVYMPINLSNGLFSFVQIESFTNAWTCFNVDTSTFFSHLSLFCWLCNIFQQKKWSHLLCMSWETMVVKIFFHFDRCVISLCFWPSFLVCTCSSSFSEETAQWNLCTVMNLMNVW